MQGRAYEGFSRTSVGEFLLQVKFSVAVTVT